MYLIYILIALLVILMVYQSYLEMFPNVLIEGLENADTTTTSDTTTSDTTTSNTNTYKPYNLNDPNNALILAQQNAGNIQSLKDTINDLDVNEVKNTLNTMQQSMDSMQTQINSLVQQQADYAQEMAGSTPPTITGTDEETPPEEEDN